MKVTSISTAAAQPQLASNASDELAIDEAITIAACELREQIANITAAYGLIHLQAPQGDDDKDGHGELIVYLGERIYIHCDHIRELAKRLRSKDPKSAPYPKIVTDITPAAELVGSAIAHHLKGLTTAADLIRQLAPDKEGRDQARNEATRYLVQQIFNHVAEIDKEVMPILLGGRDYMAPVAAL